MTDYVPKAQTWNEKVTEPIHAERHGKACRHATSTLGLPPFTQHTATRTTTTTTTTTNEQRIKECLPFLSSLPALLSCRAREECCSLRTERETDGSRRNRHTDTRSQWVGGRRGGGGEGRRKQARQDINSEREGGEKKSSREIQGKEAVETIEGRGQGVRGGEGGMTKSTPSPSLLLHTHETDKIVTRTTLIQRRGRQGEG